jgi:hypothetical protein
MSAGNSHKMLDIYVKLVQGDRIVPSDYAADKKLRIDQEHYLEKRRGLESLATVRPPNDAQLRNRVGLKVPTGRNR